MLFCHFSDSQEVSNHVLIFLFVELEWMLSEIGVLKTDLESNPRKKVEDVLLSSLRGSYVDNDDW